MVVEENILVINSEEKNKSCDWVHDSLYKKKLINLLNDLEKKEFIITHLPNGDIDACYCRMFKIRYYWCHRNSRFIRMRSNNRNYKDKNTGNEEFN